MRDDTTAQSPRDGGGEIVVLTTRQHGHPVHTASGTLKTSPGGKKAELYRVDTDVPCITNRDVAMLLGGQFNQPIPDRNVRKRIK